MPNPKLEPGFPRDAQSYIYIYIYITKVLHPFCSSERIRFWTSTGNSLVMTPSMCVSMYSSPTNFLKYVSPYAQTKHVLVCWHLGFDLLPGTLQMDLRNNSILCQFSAVAMAYSLIKAILPRSRANNCEKYHYNRTCFYTVSRTWTNAGKLRAANTLPNRPYVALRHFAFGFLVPQIQ